MNRRTRHISLVVAIALALLLHTLLFAVYQGVLLFLALQPQKIKVKKREPIRVEFYSQKPSKPSPPPKKPKLYSEANRQASAPEPDAHQTPQLQAGIAQGRKIPPRMVEQSSSLKLERPKPQRPAPPVPKTPPPAPPPEQALEPEAPQIVLLTKPKTDASHKKITPTVVQPRKKTKAVKKQRQRPQRKQNKAQKEMTQKKPRFPGGKIPLKLSPSLGELTYWDAKQHYNKRRGGRGKREATINVDTQELKYASYMRRLKERVRRGWVYPTAAKRARQSGRLMIAFSIDKSGRILNPRIIRSSGVTLLDAAALKAVRNASPSGKLPGYWNLDIIHLRFSFEYLINNIRWRR